MRSDRSKEYPGPSFDARRSICSVHHPGSVSLRSPYTTGLDSSDRHCRPPSVCHVAFLKIAPGTPLSLLGFSPEQEALFRGET
ncbi:unnamed protein product [Lota lota]